MPTLVLLRHGQSEWNVDPSRFTGWVDVDLSEQGRSEARRGGAKSNRPALRDGVRCAGRRNRVLHVR